MQASLEKLKDEWYEISIGLKNKDIEELTLLLKKLSNKPDQHFHLTSNYEGKGGISDIEIYLDDDSANDNLSITGFAK